MALTSEIDNYPGFPQGVDGFELGLQMKEGAERFGAETVLAEVFSLKLEGQIKEADTSEGIFRGRTVVFATGANPKNLGVPEEQQLTGKGLHYCAHCDGMFYRNKTVMVVGGGNTAAADALLLSRIAKKVILVHRRDALRATKIYHEPLKQAENVEFIWNSAIEELLYDDRLSGLRVRNLHTGEERIVPCDGLFVSIGRSPATELVRGILPLDEAGYVIAGESTETAVPGVFAVGDVRSKELRQIITAASDGAVAAHYAEKYLLEN
jgi:thioredoxin reductase (NADPH)